MLGFGPSLSSFRFRGREKEVLDRFEEVCRGVAGWPVYLEAILKVFIGFSRYLLLKKKIMGMNSRSLQMSVADSSANNFYLKILRYQFDFSHAQDRKSDYFWTSRNKKYGSQNLLYLQDFFVPGMMRPLESSPKLVVEDLAE